MAENNGGSVENKTLPLIGEPSPEIFEANNKGLAWFADGKLIIDFDGIAADFEGDELPSKRYQLKPFEVTFAWDVNQDTMAAFYGIQDGTAQDLTDQDPNLGKLWEEKD